MLPSTPYCRMPNLEDEDIMRIARAVKATLREEIKELVAREVAKAVEPLKSNHSMLEEENSRLFHQRRIRTIWSSASCLCLRNPCN